MKGFLSQARGFSVIEALLAAGIISASMLGLGVGLQQVAQSRSQVRAVSAALALESALQTAMQDPAQYQPIAASLRSGATALPTFDFKLRTTDLNGVEHTIPLAVNQDVNFDGDGQLCPGACPNWVFRTHVEGRMKTTNPMPIYAIAYRFVFNPQQLRLVNLGSTRTTFVATDFKWMIPLDAYQNQSLQSCNVGDRDTIVTGIDRDTLQVNCLKVGDNTQCGPNEIATGWVYETAANGEPVRQLKMGCKSLNVYPTCPTLGAGGYEYVMNRIDPSTSDTNPQGQCVFVAQGSAPVALDLASSGSSRSATFNVCPEHYVFQPANTAPAGSNGCEFTIQQTLQGWRDTGCPAGFIGSNWVRDVNPAPLRALGTVQNSGRSVLCSLQNDQQILPGANNWAGYEARLSLKGSCVLSKPDMQSVN